MIPKSTQNLCVRAGTIVLLALGISMLSGAFGYTAIGA